VRKNNLPTTAVDVTRNGIWTTAATCSASDSAYSYSFLCSVVCLSSVCRASHSCIKWQYVV